MKLKDKASRKANENFAFRLRMGDYEIDVTGTHENVLKTIENLPDLMNNIDKAFEKVKRKRLATLTVKTEAPYPQRTLSHQYPQVVHTDKIDEAILRVLETDWGKWRPRTIDELSEALKSNEIQHSARALSGVLTDLVKKEKIKRWITNAGNVYILAEKEALRSKGEVE